MSESTYLPGSPRLFNNHSVCTECGAMIDNDFIFKHEVSHGREADAEVHNEVQLVAAEYRNEERRKADEWSIEVKKASRWPFRLRQ